MMSNILQHISMALILLNPSSSVSKWTPEIPPECENENYCDVEIPNYPKRAFINGTIKKLQKEGYMIEFEKHPFNPPPTLGPNDRELCRAEFRRLFPTAAKDAKTNQWHFVINDPYRPVQVVTVEVCSKQYAACDNLNSEHFRIRSGYQANCVQKFFYKALIGYNETGHVIHFETYMPMCCACVAEQKHTTTD